MPTWNCLLLKTMQTQVQTRLVLSVISLYCSSFAEGEGRNKMGFLRYSLTCAEMGTVSTVRRLFIYAGLPSRI